MADHGWSDLPYGHFGSAAYDINENAWNFRTSPDLAIQVVPLGEPTLVIQPCLQSSEGVNVAPQPSTDPKSVRLGKQTKNAARADPDLRPAASLFRPLLQASEAVEEALSHHDPAKGDLLAFGRISDQVVRRSCRVVAFASGASGCDLRIVQVQLQKQGWADSRDVWLEVPMLAGQETTLRTGASPIQQICFGQPVEGGESLLAARLSTHTVILKPVIRKQGSTQLDANLMYTLSNEQTGGSPHADITFNPWFTRQFAVIDQLGRWSIWEFQSSRSTFAKCIRFPTKPDKADDSVSRLNDRWAHIQWIGKPTTVLVVDRRNVSLFNTSAEAGQPQRLDVGLSGAAGWVLDVVTVSASLQSFCVLTTSHIILFSMDETDGEIQARMDACIRHYRSPEDVTLKLLVFDDTQDLVTILLRSALSPINTVHRVKYTEAGLVALHMPSGFNLPNGHTGAEASARLLTLDVQAVIMGSKRSTESDGFTTSEDGKNTGSFFLATMLAKDLSISQSLYSSALLGTEKRLDAPAWKGKLPSTSSKLQEDFVEDEDTAALEQHDLPGPPVPMFRQRRRSRQISRAGTQADWTVDYTLCSQRLESGSIQAIPLEDTLRELRQHLRDSLGQEVRPMQTLRGKDTNELTITDLDQASKKLQDLTEMNAVKLPATNEDAEAAEQKDGLFSRKVDTIPAFGKAMNGGENLAAVYDSVIAQWVSSLPSSLTGRARLAKEQLARRLAAEVALASYSIRYVDFEPEKSREDLPEQTNRGWSKPLGDPGHSQQSQSSYDTASQTQSQNILPTPSPTATPSITTATSRSSSFAAAELFRLSKYTSFSKPSPSTLPRPISRILSHWEPGTDPGSYDWIGTSRQITQQLETEEADSHLTERERARLQRKAERHIRRQRKEAAASQQQQMGSNQMPELNVSVSQPVGEKVESQPSAQPASTFGGIVGSSQSQALGPASQAVAGRFGGRPPAKKKRKQGF